MKVSQGSKHLAIHYCLIVILQTIPLLVMIKSGMPQFSIKYTQTIPRPSPPPSHRQPHSSLPTHSQHHSPTSRYRTLHSSSHQQTQDGRVGRASVNMGNSSIPRLPLQYYDQTSNGGGWEGEKGRVVYRGATPKNSYYLIKQAMATQPTFKLAVPGGNSDGVEFKSKFECGNLAAACRISRNQYWLYMREDTNSNGLRQWFYFWMGSHRSLSLTLRIYKFSRRGSLYCHGMGPYLREEGGEWKQSGRNVQYLFDKVKQCYYLRWEYDLMEGQPVEVAAMPVYSYSQMNQFIDKQKRQRRIGYEVVGETLGGLQIPLITIPSLQSPQKPVIIIIGRTHPSETCSNFTLQTIVSHLPDFPLLLSIFDFHILPMVNPDGVVAGNHRTSLTGVDLNRKFNAHKNEIDLYPEVKAVRKLISGLKKNRKVEYVFDFHGHSGRANIFAFGDREEPHAESFFKSRLLPKMLGECCPAFRYDYSVFSRVRYKQGTARVWCKRRWGLDCLTFEQSYGLVGEKKIGVDIWREFGIAFLRALTEYVTRFMGKEGKIREYLRQEHAKEVQRRQQQQARKEESKQIKEVENSSPTEIDIPTPEQPEDKQSSERSSEHSSLESAEQQLQNTTQHLNELASILFPALKPRSPIQRTSPVRQSLSIPDAQIFLNRQERFSAGLVRTEKMPIISRILHMRERHRGGLVGVLTSGRGDKSVREERKERGEGPFRLPNLYSLLQ